MELNYRPVFVAAFAPLVLGAIWYSPILFAMAWMRESKLTEADLKGANMIKIFGLTYLFSVMIAFMMMSITIHQTGAAGMVGGPPEMETVKPSYEAFMADYGHAFRTFKHGALHGFIAGLFIAFPIVAINGLFERKTWKYILINSGFWIISLTLMGAIVCGLS